MSDKGDKLLEQARERGAARRLDLVRYPAYTDKEVLVEFEKRGAMLLPSGAVVTKLYQNTVAFRERLTAWRRAGGDVGILKGAR